MIRITRGTTHRDRFSAYEIFIDGVRRGKIQENETKEFEVEKGSHIVYAKVEKHWCRSNKLSVDVRDSVVELAVDGTDGGYVANAGHNLLYAIIFWNRYLWLKEKGSVEANLGEIKLDYGMF